ncbi:hypothetical protein L7F22_065820 [Adiantum nelumboides]|nr:hypothetical protein [Adiantum nelumboides]
MPDTLGSTDVDASSELCRAWGEIRDHQSLVFFDPGARANFITPQLAEKMGIKTDEMGPAYTASMAAPGHEVAVTPLIGKLRLHIQGYVGHEEFFIMPLEGCDVLLGPATALQALCGRPSPRLMLLAGKFSFPSDKHSFYGPDNLHVLSYMFYVNWEAVTSPYGTVLHNAEMVQSGKFGFTTSEAGIYMACFWLPASQTGLTLHVELDWKVGVAAKDWDAVAKKDRIEGIELELLKLQDAVDSIHETLLYMKEREKEMRNVNEYTNGRVAWYGITSLFVCLAVTGWQLWHLRSFFERKKLL